MAIPPPEIETPRLVLRRFVFEDAPQVVELLTQPSFLQNIGDRGVRNVEDAHRYLREGPMAMYGQHGFGLWHVSRRSDGEFVGMCGLLKRDILPDVDIGYAYLPAHWGQGYAYEAAVAAMDYAVDVLGWNDVIHTIDPDNTPSQKLAARLGSTLRGPGRFPPPYEKVPCQIWAQTSAQWKAQRAQRYLAPL